MTTLTVRQLADHIRRPSEDISAVIDRLRNWTDEDLLTLIGDKNPGTGKHRQYSRSALVEAIVLTYLSEAVGQAVTKPSFVKMFRFARKAGVFAQKAGYFVIACSTKLPTTMKTVGVDDLGIELSKSKHDAHIVLDFEKLHQRSKEIR